MKEFLPTKRIAPRPGEPKDLHAILMAQVQREDRGVEGFVRTYEERSPENMVRELPTTRRDAIARNWGLGNIQKFALSLMP